MLKKTFITIQKYLLVAPRYIINISNKLFSFFILMMAVGVMLYAGSKVYLVYKAFLSYNFKNLLYEAVFLMVLVKAFQMLLSYYKNQYVSIKQMLELTIIALIVKAAFSLTVLELWSNVTLDLFTVGCIVLYLIFHDKLLDIEKK